jgi:hypothetical protein
VRERGCEKYYSDAIHKKQLLGTSWERCNTDSRKIFRMCVRCLGHLVDYFYEGFVRSSVLHADVVTPVETAAD